VASSGKRFVGVCVAVANEVTGGGFVANLVIDDAACDAPSPAAAAAPWAGWCR
jgi:hypothetical protein